jgi:hypothetical protein
MTMYMVLTCTSGNDHCIIAAVAYLHIAPAATRQNHDLHG